MIRTLALENYRGFRHFELHDLGRVNLIVGTNNAGKTSVLEAIHILEAAGDFNPIWACLSRRGEDFEEREAASVYRTQVDIRRLFHGHDAAVGEEVRITGTTDQGRRGFRAFITEPRPDSSGEQRRLFDNLEGAVETEFLSRGAALGLEWEADRPGAGATAMFDLSRRGGLTAGLLRRQVGAEDGQRPPIRFITASALSPDVVIDLFEDVVLTPYEDFVVQALRIIEPAIERIATGGTDRRRAAGTRVGTRGGMLVRCKGIAERIPIGSMGDGIWRLLGLALALARSEGGVLLIDEIDTGLHYSVMESMWRLVSQTASRLRIQVFATTHSRDCYESLAAVCRDAVLERSEVTLQRIERGYEKAVAYSEQEIIAAARRHLEVR